MKEYRDVKTEVVIEKRCTLLKCDNCGREAEYPKDGLFEWGTVGSASGSIECHLSIDGEYQSEELDLCYECALSIIKTIKHGKIK